MTRESGHLDRAPSLRSVILSSLSRLLSTSQMEYCGVRIEERLKGGAGCVKEEEEESLLKYGGELNQVFFALWRSVN